LGQFRVDDFWHVTQLVITIRFLNPSLKWYLTRLELTYKKKQKNVSKQTFLISNSNTCTNTSLTSHHYSRIPSRFLVEKKNKIKNVRNVLDVKFKNKLISLTTIQESELIPIKRTLVKFLELNLKTNSLLTTTQESELIPIKKKKKNVIKCS
jgi:hypothetical protein